MKIEKITPQIAALYLGQKCALSKAPSFQKYSLSPEFRVGEIRPLTTRVLNGLESGDYEFTLYLRSLDSITEDEAIHIHDLVFGFQYAGVLPCKEWICLAWSGESSFYQDARGYPIAWLYLLSKGIDLFGLIDSGLAKKLPV